MRESWRCDSSAGLKRCLGGDQNEDDLQGSPPLSGASVLSASWLEPLAPFQVLTFRTRARLSFAPPTCRMPLGQSQCIPQAHPGRWVSPPVLTSSNRISTLLQRFACARLSQSCLSKSCSDFSATFTTIAFDDSSLRWLEIST